MVGLSWCKDAVGSKNVLKPIYDCSISICSMIREGGLVIDST